MNTIQHWDILLSNTVNKKAFIDTVLNGNAKGELAPFNSLNGILFSDIAIDKFIEKEYQYDVIEAATTSERKLRTFLFRRAKKGVFELLCKSKSRLYYFR